MLVLAPPTKNLLCCYTNRTARIQILRISDIPDHFFEHSVMPQDTVLFEAPSEAHLEVHSSEMVGSILSDVIPCARLAKSCDIRERLSQIIQRKQQEAPPCQSFCSALPESSQSCDRPSPV